MEYKILLRDFLELKNVSNIIFQNKDKRPLTYGSNFNGTNELRFFPVDKVCARSLPTKLASTPKCLL